MFRAIATLFSCLVIAAGLPITAQADERLSGAAVRSDVRLLEQSLAHLHPGYTRFADPATLADAWSRIVATANANGGMTQAELYVAVSRVLTMIRCNHTKAELPKNLGADRRTTPTYLPFRWRLIGPDRRAVIIASTANSDIRRGDEIVAIDGVSIDTLVEAFVDFIPADGFADAARYAEVAFSSEFPGGALEHFGALLAPVTETVTIDFVRADGHRFTRTVKRLSGDEWRAMLATSGGFYRNFRDAVDVNFIESGIAVLAVATFVNYRQPVEPAAVYDPVFRALIARRVDSLIVDLRGNGGGSASAQLGLLERLIDEPTRLMRDVVAAANTLGPAAEHVESWDQRALAMAASDYTLLADGTYRVNPDWVGRSIERITPHRLGFGGKIVILVDATLSSGSNHLVSRLREQSNVVLVGSDGGGNAAGATAGVLYTLRLPVSGIGVRIPAWRQAIDRDGLLDGQPVRPDVRVQPTLATWRRGEDPVLAVALTLVREQR
ncbi:MAG: S41 family peptidase [Pseudomonadota bacterium]